MSSDCYVRLILDAAKLSDKPLAHISLPARTSSGTHAHWNSAA